MAAKSDILFRPRAKVMRERERERETEGERERERDVNLTLVLHAKLGFREDDSGFNGIVTA